MKILITGMTSQQCNPTSHVRVGNFAGYLRQVLRDNGLNSVWWQDPSIDMDLDQWDHVFVGVAPITSLGANRAYGALSIISRLWGRSRKLTLFVDAPDPLTIQTSLAAIDDNPDNLLKSFFSYRKEYRKAISTPEIRRQLLSAVSLLRNETWPHTLVPRLPWQSESAIKGVLPPGARERARSICLDAYVYAAYEDKRVNLVTAPSRWAFEPGNETKWLSRQATTWDPVEVPRSSRVEADSQAVALLRGSAGCLIAPSRSGTWWNTRYAMSLAQGVPVFTDWQESQALGGAWATLPGAYEHLSPEERVVLAELQIESYLQAAGSAREVQAKLSAIMARKFARVMSERSV